jgi:hypothetical protein
MTTSIDRPVGGLGKNNAASAASGSALTLADAVNGLKHMADDHKCCATFIGGVIVQMQKMEQACNTALWIRDRIQDRGGFGAALEEWKEIEMAIAPNVEPTSLEASNE